MQQQQEKREIDEYFRYFNKCQGVIVIFFELFIMTQSAYCIIVESLPNTPFFQEHALLLFFLQAFYFAILCLTIRSFYYGYTTTSDAKEVYRMKNTHKKNDQAAVSALEGLKPRYCNNCQIYKLQEVHHCKICNRCIAGMDHHCNFLGNCIGIFNYRFFLSYIFFIFTLTLIGHYAMRYPIRLLLELEFSKIDGKIWRLVVVYLSNLFSLIFTTLLLFLHLYLFMNSMTQLEYKYSMKELRNPCCKIIQHCLFINRQNEQNFVQDFLIRWKQVFGSDSDFRAILYPPVQVKELETLMLDGIFKNTELNAALDSDATNDQETLNENEQDQTNNHDDSQLVLEIKNYDYQNETPELGDQDTILKQEKL